MPRKAVKATKAVVKTFLLDTNVLIHDPEAVFAFDEHDVIIPITVIEELDGLKKGEGEVAAAARRASRIILDLAKAGVGLGESKGKFAIFAEPIEFKFKGFKDCPDNYILGIAYQLSKTNPNFVLVTNDANLAIKAMAFMVNTQEYKADRADISSIGRIQTIEGEDGDFDEDGTPSVNQCFIYQDRLKGSNLLRTHLNGGEIEYIEIGDRKKICGISPRNAEQRFLVDMLLDENIDLVIVNGAAGAGKTLLSMAVGVDGVQKQKYDRLTITKVIQSFGNDIGFLPGSLEEKMDPHLKPFWDNLEVLLRKDGEAQRFKQSDKLEVDALTFIRGRSFTNRYVIVDEIQNLTPKSIRTIVSRVGEGTKMVLLGDVSQIDSPYLTRENNGLAYAMNRLCDHPNVGVLTMTETKRSRLAELAVRCL